MSWNTGGTAAGSPAQAAQAAAHAQEHTQEWQLTDLLQCGLSANFFSQYPNCCGCILNLGDKQLNRAEATVKLKWTD